MSLPLVAVEMAAYNHEKYIAQAIESVVIQKSSFRIKLIICEDGSSDNTQAICSKYRDAFPDKIDLYINEKNTGLMPNSKKLHTLSFNSGA